MSAQEEPRRSRAFVDLVRHDLHAPVRAISSLATFIAEDLPEETSAATRAHVATISERAARLHSLIDDLARYDRADIMGDAEAVSVRSLIESTVDDVDAISPGTRVDIDVEVDLTVWVESDAVRSCLLEVVENAAMHRAQSLRGSVQVSASTHGDMLSIVVEDDGFGILPEYQTMVFEPLRKLHSTDAVTGNGMGLAIVKRTMNSRGGDVRLHSTIDSGTVVRMSWPAPRVSAGR